MNLTANFSLTEMVKSETALRHGMENTPGEAEIAALRLLCEKVLQPVRDHYGVGVKVNSGYRSPDVNSKVGGSRTSDHCLGQASDIEIPGVANADLAVWIMENLDYTQLILEFYTPGIGRCPLRRCASPESRSPPIGSDRHRDGKLYR